MGAVAAQNGPRRVKPADEAIYTVYLAEVQKREHGAYARTARAFQGLVSDQHVANVVRRMEGKQNVASQRNVSEDPRPVGLTYVPAPGELELERQRQNEAFLRQLLGVGTPTEPLPEAAHNVPIERAEIPTPTPTVPASPAIRPRRLPHSYLANANANAGPRGLIILTWFCCGMAPLFLTMALATAMRDYRVGWLMAAGLLVTLWVGAKAQGG